MVLLVGFVAQPARAQQLLPAGAPPRLQRTEAEPAGWSVEIAAFLKQLTETCAKTETYRDQGRVTLVQRRGRVKSTTEMPMELAFRRPNRLLLDAGQHQVACDGKSLVAAVADLRQFTSRPAPERLERDHLQAASVMGGVEQGHPELIDFLIRPDAYEPWQKQMVKVAWQSETSIDGAPCRVLEYETVEGTKVKIFVDARRKVVLRVHALGATEGQNIDVSYELGRVTLNAPVEEKAFAFTPPGDYRRVAQFNSARRPRSIVNQRRPRFRPRRRRSSDRPPRPSPARICRAGLSPPVSWAAKSRCSISGRSAADNTR